MPRHPEFEKIYWEFISRYGAEEGRKLYYAWLKKYGFDDTKSFSSQKHKLGESFEWISPIEWFGLDRKIKGLALTPKCSLNKNCYVEEELVKAARTLADKPIYVNHVYDGVVVPGQIKPQVGKVVDAEYVAGKGVEYVGYIEDSAVWELIRKGEIRSVSIAGKYREAEKVDSGVKPLGLRFEELSLLYGDVQPGIPEAYVEVWEKILEKIVENHEKNGSLNLNEQIERLAKEVDKLKKENEILKQKIARFELPGEKQGVQGRVFCGNPVEKLNPEEKRLVLSLKLRETPLKDVVDFDLKRGMLNRKTF